MAAKHTLCASFLLELFKGTHDFSSNTFKMALYTESATINVDTTAYTATGECTGTGYTAGGFTLTKATGFPKLNDDVVPGVGIGRIALMTFNNLSITNLTALPRYALIYNASKSNKAVLIRDFGAVLPLVNDNLTVQFPTPSVFDCILKLNGILE